jgi:hypothetical protein
VESSEKERRRRLAAATQHLPGARGAVEQEAKMAAETAALLDAVVKATESCPAADEVHRPASELALALSRLQRPLAELKAALATLALPATTAAAPSAQSGERLTLLSRNAEEGIGSPPGALGGAGAGAGTGGADGSVGAGGEAATDEAKLAAWERSNLNGQDRRDARIKRGACTFCGVSGHKANQCPAKPARVNALAYDDDVAALHVDTENGVGESESAGFDESQAARIVRHGQALLAAMPSWHTQLASLAPLSSPNRALLRPVTHHPAAPLCRSSLPSTLAAVPSTLTLDFTAAGLRRRWRRSGTTGSARRPRERQPPRARRARRARRMRRARRARRAAGRRGRNNGTRTRWRCCGA